MISQKLIGVSVFCICLILPQQFLAQALNTTVRSNWDDNGLVAGPLNNVYNDIWGYADGNGREYAIIGSGEYTLFIDVTDPDNPVEVDRELGGSICTWRDYKIYGHYAYGVSDGCSGGLEIFDLSSLPDSVTKVYDSIDFMEDSHNVFIDTTMGKLYACGISAGVTDIVILDLTQDPANPELIKNLSLPDGYVHDLYVRNDTAYCSHIYIKKLIIYDFSDLDNISSLGMYSSPGSNHSNWVSDDGNVMVVADESRNRPVRVVDISDIESPTELSTFKSTLLAPLHTNSVAHNPFIVGNDFVVLSYYDDGLQIFKIDSAAFPFQAGYYDTDTIGTTYSYDGSWGAYPYLPSGNLLASDQDHGLFVITPQFPLYDCKSNVLVKGVYDNFWTFLVEDIFSTSASYIDQAKIEIVAPDEINFLPNFNLQIGSTLTATIEDACSFALPKKPVLSKKPRVGR